MARITQLRVNGRTHRVDADENASLLSVLREQLDLTGAKYGCGEGQCGACTVLVGGVARRSCITPAGEASGESITTIEGLGEGEKLHPVQQAFAEENAFQCAYCTPGMILSAAAFLRANPNPSTEDIVDAMQGNVCRCGTYPRIVKAIQSAARALREARR